MILKLSNNEVMELHAKNVSNPESLARATGIETKYFVNYEIKEEAGKTLLKTLVTHSKLSFGGTDYLIAIKDKRAEKFQEIITCVLK